MLLGGVPVPPLPFGSVPSCSLRSSVLFVYKPLPHSWDTSRMSATIVVGTDLSAGATEAVTQAHAWARRVGARLLVVHVAPDEIFRALETPRVASALEDRVAEIVGRDVPFEVTIAAGSPHGELVRLADERNATLLVIAASSTTGLERVLFGSTAGQVVRYAHCPVLVARPSPERGGVVAATDFSEHATAAIDAAATEARLRAVPLKLVHSYYEPSSSLTLLGPVVMGLPSVPEAERENLQRAARDTLETLVLGAKATGTSELLEGPPAAAIVQAAKASGAALIVVATHGRTGLSRMALGSVAESVARDAPCSVLAVRRGQSK